MMVPPPLHPLPFFCSLDSLPDHALTDILHLAMALGHTKVIRAVCHRWCNLSDTSVTKLQLHCWPSDGCRPVCGALPHLREVRGGESGREGGSCRGLAEGGWGWGGMGWDGEESFTATEYGIGKGCGEGSPKSRGREEGWRWGVDRCKGRRRGGGKAQGGGGGGGVGKAQGGVAR